MLPFPILNHYGNNTNPTHNVKKFMTGAANTGLLYDNGEFYTGGINTNYQLGLGTNTNMYGTHNLSHTNVDSFYIHGTGTIAILSTGIILFVGRNYNFYGTAGNTTAWADVTSYFSAVGLSITNIADIQMGNNGTVVLDSTGNMYGIGLNSNGEFGKGNTTALTAFTLLDTSVQKISYVASSLYYLKSNSLYRAGLNTSGELGDGTAVNKTTFVQLTGANYAGLVTDVRGSTSGCMILCNPSAGNRYYYTGIRGYGAQGNGADTTFVSSFTNQSSMNSKITSLIQGTSGSSNYVSHVYASDGIYGCGYDNQGAVGTAGVNRTGNPVRILPWTICSGIPISDLTQIKFFSAYDGINASFFVYNNSLYGCGTVTHTGIATTNVFTKLTNTPY